MATEDRAILQEVGIMHRGRAVDSGQNKAVPGIHGRMLFDSEMRLLVFDRPVAFQVARELQRFAIFILLTFFGITMGPFLFYPVKLLVA